MPKGYRRASCRICDRHISECGSLSARGKCQACATSRVAANYVDLQLRTGPFFRNWRRAMAASVGGVLVDDLDESER